MSGSPDSSTEFGRVADSGDMPLPASDWVSELNWMLEDLERSGPAGPPLDVGDETDNQLAQVRLGIATSLFTALRCKHVPAAAHSLRVALSSSLWCLAMELPQRQRDMIEIAALLHDVGLIGVPDEILLKPSALDADEAMLIERARAMSLEILRDASAEPAILDIVKNIAAWYDGSRSGYKLSGEEIPLGARIIAIVEAFDAMTSERVFRRAMSHERALSELFACAGSQFDPQLVSQFSQLRRMDQAQLREEVGRRWFRSLDREAVNSYWELNHAASHGDQSEHLVVFEAELLKNMHDAAVFLDENLKVTLWNSGAERLTGISSTSVCQHRWMPELLKMEDEKGKAVSQKDCPAQGAIASGVQSLRRMTIWGRAGRPISVDVHVIPVISGGTASKGAILLLHDASPEISLERRCQSLHEKATKDPLTQVANRAEFDRVQETFIAAHLQQQLPCSLIMCDLDHFKRVNDTYGHQAGDAVIRSLATLLKHSCRPGDLVARYGGEEFVVLCADCNNATAAGRAERIRKVLSLIPHPEMEGRCVTASFGVTEIQPGDSPETMFRRTDRALLTAKSNGRNTVVQLGIGSGEKKPAEKRRFWKQRSAVASLVLEQDLLTTVPIRVAIEKLRGFVADHQAKIVKVESNTVQLDFDDDRVNPKRRRSDRSVAFLIDVQLDEGSVEDAAGQGNTTSTASRTKLHISITLKRNRDRRRDDVAQRAQQVLMSFRSYLMAADDAPSEQGVFRRAKNLLAPWLTKE